MNSGIRPMLLSDWESVASLEREEYGARAYPAEFLRMIPVLFSTTAWVVDSEGVVGYCLAVREDTDHKRAWLLALVVSRSHRKQGLGGRLIDHAVGQLVASGVQEILLTVESSNAAAIGLYQGAGFRDLGLQMDFFGPGQDRLLMVYGVD